MRWTMVSKKWDEIGTLKLIVQQEFTNDVYDVTKIVDIVSFVWDEVQGAWCEINHTKEK